MVELGRNSNHRFIAITRHNFSTDTIQGAKNMMERVFIGGSAGVLSALGNELVSSQAD